jgi:uncharacterized protein (DUF2336 family)
LQALGADPQPWVRAGVALREDLSPTVIILLADEQDRDVLGALGRNPRAPAAQLEAIARHSDKDVRRSVAFNPAAPAGALVLLAADPYPLNRAILAGHPGLALPLAESLLHDPEPQVRFAAAARLARSAATGRS